MGFGGVMGFGWMRFVTDLYRCLGVPLKLGGKPESVGKVSHSALKPTR